MPEIRGVPIIRADYVRDVAGMIIGQCLAYYDNNLFPDT
jgi:hypothetical protein